ncbi:hypothetical protein AOB57_003865 [Methanosarcina flavescens]|uniref:Uncharacterized protein n=1 Tax=Methanosarcina flavescens TaxID=1715806 RepID=A0A660HQD8_9EURY|nr:hypothetical protein AOB57_003865 [Methanosarcina flavescens]
MGNTSISMFCSVCQTKLKRQVLGSNIFYYCRNCGCVSSEAYLTGGVEVFQHQNSTSVNRAASSLSFMKTPKSM